MTELSAAARLFDAAWYLAVYPDVAGQDPFEHFCRCGAAEGRDPNPMFSTAWYKQRYPAVADANPLEDFVDQGVAQERDPGPLFSTRWYLARYPDIVVARANPLEHYLHWGRVEGRDPSPVFDTTWYFMTYPQSVEAGVDARLHYMREGAALGHDPSPWFKSGWYLATYPEVAASGQNPLLHYLTRGVERGYDPSPTFSSSRYLAANNECVESGENPLVHSLIQQRLNLSVANTVSSAAIAASKALVDAFSDIEPEFFALSGKLDRLPSRSLAPDRSMLAWRALYMSIYKLPKHVLLVGRIDDEPGLAGFTASRECLLILETDTTEASTSETLPQRTEWRSLAEFDGALAFSDRIRVAVALVNSLQPEALTVWGSRIGWEVLTRYGDSLRQHMSLAATGHAAPNMLEKDLIHSYVRDCLPSLNALYAEYPADIERIASVLRLAASERSKLHLMVGRSL